MTERAIDNDTANNRIRFYGDTGVLVEFEEATTEPTINAVITLNDRLLALKLRGIMSTTPSYTSLLIMFDPRLIAGLKVASIIADLLEDLHPQLATSKQRGTSVSWQLPAAFAADNVEDALALRDELDLSWQEIIDKFCAVSYRVNAIGFLPGFTYLGGLPAQLACRRLDTPRVRIPGSSVAIAGKQAGIYPMNSPGGWRVLGRLPFAIFDRERSSPALFSPNDQISFVPVPASYFAELASDAKSGQLDLERFKQ